MVQMTYARFFREQWSQTPLVTGDLSARSLILTGASGGLGLHAASHLAAMRPYRLWLTYKNLANCPPTFHALQSGSPQTVATSLLDLASFASVKELESQAGTENIDTFVGNAAMATRSYTRTKDGWETALQVNYLSNALLCILLLPHLIKNSSPDSYARIILLSSDGHHFVSQNKLPKEGSILNTLNDPEYCTPTVMRNRYDVSKTLLLMFADELAARLPKESHVSVMNINPGFCHSGLTRETESKLWGKLLVGTFKQIVARPTEEGSRTIVHAVVTPDPRKFHGQYITACQIAGESDFLSKPEGLNYRASLWRETIEVLNKVDPRVEKIIKTHLLPVKV
ncbi:short-chain dehydrogenase [Mycena leptocephala]|nr:short-chain dehydrogenase [Mycena leptocephala]